MSRLMVDRPHCVERWRAVACAAIAASVLLIGCGVESSGGGSTSHSETTAALAAEAPEVGAETTEAPTTTPPTTERPTTAPRPAGIRVTRVIDGDTVELADGNKVRLTGIDTPERGECGYGEAAKALSDMVMGRDVVLVAGARDDTDRYGRLIRYIEVDGVDANLAMIRSGWAIARYDSRDGYGRHQREDDYIAADVGTPVRPECAGASGVAGGDPGKRAVASTTIAPAGGGTSPRFGTCKEAKANGYGPYVRGVHPEYDWYRDRDGDGTVCE